MNYKLPQRLSWIVCLHEVLPDKESSESCEAQPFHCQWIGDSTLAHLAPFSRKARCHAEGVLHISYKRAEVAVVNTIHIGFQFSIVEFFLIMHLQ